MERVALVTGAASGIGRAIASRFAAEGWTVYATDVTRDGLDDLRGCETARMDVTDPDAIERVVGRVEARHGAVDLLVNNAGYAELGPVEDVPIDATGEQFDVNVTGPLRLCRAVLPAMRDRDAGRIVTVSSIFGRVVFPGFGSYSASKFAVEAYADALRRELVTTDVEIALVQPAWVDTGFAATARQGLADREQTETYRPLYRLFERTPLVDGGTLAVSPARVAAVVHEAATAPDPDARYPVGPQARALLATSRLPDRLLDAIAWGLFRLSARFGDRGR